MQLHYSLRDEAEENPTGFASFANLVEQLIISSYGSRLQQQLVDLFSELDMLTDKFKAMLTQFGGRKTARKATPSKMAPTIKTGGKKDFSCQTEVLSPMLVKRPFSQSGLSFGSQLTNRKKLLLQNNRDETHYLVSSLDVQHSYSMTLREAQQEINSLEPAESSLCLFNNNQHLSGDVRLARQASQRSESASIGASTEKVPSEQKSFNFKRSNGSASRRMLGGSSSNQSIKTKKPKAACQPIINLGRKHSAVSDFAVSLLQKRS